MNPGPFLALAFVAIATLLSSVPALATLRRVPADHATIQAAVQAAFAGDTVLVAPGVYAGPGNRDIDFLGKAIVVRSSAGAGATVVDCGGSAGAPHRGFFFHTGEVNAAVLEGFTIQNGFVVGPMNGGGIECEYASPTIRSCVVRTCRVDAFGSDGGGICCRTSSARIEDCTVSGNYASYGGGIACRGDQPVTILRCTVTGNGAAYGGGIDAGGIGAPLIRDCLVAGNSCSGGMGGTPSGGGVLLGGAAALQDCVVTGNAATSGGGLYCFSGTPRVEGCTIAGNHAPDGSGGGLYALDTNVAMERTILWNNCADVSGNAITAGSGGAVSYGCCILDPAQIHLAGGVVHDLGDNLADDPGFCAPLPCALAPTVGGAYAVTRTSRAFPDANPCGAWIGALRVGCPTADAPESMTLAGPGGLIFWPHPVTDRMTCRIDLRRCDRVHLSLVDASGRVVGDLMDEVLTAGSHLREFDLDRGDGSLALRAGIYYLRLTATDARAARPLVLLH
jgi:hypothetical protein